MLEGEVEIYGAYVNGYVRPENEKADRVVRRLAVNQNPKKRCIITIRQRGEKGKGAVKTKTFVVKSENQANLKKLASENIAKDSEVHADEAKGYDPFYTLHSR